MDKKCATCSRLTPFDGPFCGCMEISADYVCEDWKRKDMKYRLYWFKCYRRERKADRSFVRWGYPRAIAYTITGR